MNLWAQGVRILSDKNLVLTLPLAFETLALHTETI
jgi:hypothetical protein